MISNLQVIALLPQLLSNLLAVLVMALIAVRRDHRLIATVTALGLAAALASVPYAATAGPQAATALFVADGLTQFYAALILVAALGTSLLLWGYLDDLPGNREELYLLLSLAVAGALTLVAARHLASFFIGLELMSIPMYGMAGYFFAHRRGVEGVTKYLVLSGAATAFLLFGMALLYAAAGHLDFAGLAALPSGGSAPDGWLAPVGGALVLVGIAFKLSLAPFHQWTLDVYEDAPAPVGAFLATVGKVAVAGVLLRLLAESGVLDPGARYPSGAALDLLGVLALVAVASILIGNLLALRQQNLKRLLAASSTAHFGYLLVAIVAGGALAREAAGMYLAAYVATTLGAFGVISALSRSGAGQDVETLGALRGLAARSPFLALALTVMLLSLSGMPLTAGFIGKFSVIVAGSAAGLWLLLGTVVLGSAIGLAYYLRVIAAIHAAPEPGDRPLRAHRGGAVTVAFALIAVLAIGLWPQPLLAVLQQATVAHLP